MKNIPRVGIGVLVRRDGKVLLGRRINAHGGDSWQPPGGHLEFMEKVTDCARRETAEETGLDITNIQRSVFTEDMFEADDRHYISVYVIADWKSGEPQLLEPDKCAEWAWFDWGNLPTPLFSSLQKLYDDDFDPFNV